MLSGLRVIVNKTLDLVKKRRYIGGSGQSWPVFTQSRGQRHAGTPNEIVYTFYKDNFYDIYPGLRDCRWNDVLKWRNVNMVFEFYRIIYSMFD